MAAVAGDTWAATLLEVKRQAVLYLQGEGATGGGAAGSLSSSSSSGPSTSGGWGPRLGGCHGSRRAGPLARPTPCRRSQR